MHSTVKINMNGLIAIFGRFHNIRTRLTPGNGHPSEELHSLRLRRMNYLIRLSILAFLLTLGRPESFGLRSLPADHGILITGGTVIDGTGSPGRSADVRISGDRITSIGHLKPQTGERVIGARGRVVAPGFIDTHSHADSRILELPEAETAVRQGITTAIGGQDGDAPLPLDDFFSKLKSSRSAINFAMFAGHGSIRSRIMGDDFKRAATKAEIERMSALLDEEMKAGALGLSSGLEYDPGHYATTEELIDLAKVAAKHGGIYISHVRNEDNEAFDAFLELIRIAREAHIPAQISHIKLGSFAVWGKANEVLEMMSGAAKRGLDISADVYPYLYWQSTITVLNPSRVWSDRSAWEKGLADIGGPEHVLLSRYQPNPSWEGKTLKQLANREKSDPISIIQRIVRSTRETNGKEKESVIVTAMSEEDLKAFIAAPRIMFCTDEGLKPTHPRGAGSFPRILGKYVREQHILSLESAIRKMTSLPAHRMGFRDRGELKAGMAADMVIFDANAVGDAATVAIPAAKPIGITHVIVNGKVVLDGGRVTGARPGAIIRRIGRISRLKDYL